MNLTSVKNLFTLVFSVLLWMNSVSVSQANIEPIPPFMGDWEGGWVDAPQKDGNARNNPGLVARVIGLGNNRYEIQILEEFDKRADFKVKTEAVWKNGKMTFDQNGYSGKITNDSFTGNKAGGAFDTPFSLKRVHRTSPTMGKKAPENAVVLFDGSDLDAWERQGGGNPTWLTKDGYFEVLPKKDNNNVGGSINTRQSFGDVKVHLEFRLPYEPEHRGQKRANSGFFLPGGYEVQILDSYGLDGMWNECGALYKQSPPRVNMCWAPGVWQTFDVEFKRLRRDSEGNKVDHAEFTVWHNGVKIHNSFQIKGATSNTQKGRELGESGKNGGLSLQDHSNKIQFRNIWVVER
ncbi:MAG: DUF1080 domain-containing protein [Verrucomicrobia bacterium TMED71]|nr:MAG: DUF1080 domain-containing protein [Verrucomicrobia bacterium TMED71]